MNQLAVMCSSLCVCTNTSVTYVLCSYELHICIVFSTVIGSFSGSCTFICLELWMLHISADEA